MAWRKPDFLKSKAEKRFDAQISLLGTCIQLAVAVRDYNDRKTKEELEAENLRLNNELIKKKLEEKNMSMYGSLESYNEKYGEIVNVDGVQKLKYVCHYQTYCDCHPETCCHADGVYWTSKTVIMDIKQGVNLKDGEKVEYKIDNAKAIIIQEDFAI